MSKLVLSEGQVTADSPISVQLIKNHHPGARPVVVITWPSHVTECSPAKLGEVISKRRPHSWPMRARSWHVGRSFRRSLDHGPARYLCCRIGLVSAIVIHIGCS